MEGDIFVSLKWVLFDLDGTLLPMDNDYFAESYMKLLAAKLAPYGYEPREFIATVWEGVAAMVKNDGTRSNEQAFFECFSAHYGAERAERDLPVMLDFYANEFSQAKAFCGYNAAAAETVKLVKERGFRTALATNPLFPRVATLMRIGWAGVKSEEFELITTYENTSLCKPNPEYYRDVARRIGAECSECLMVGNDAREDAQAAEAAGMEVLLLTDCLINRDKADISRWPHGDFATLKEYILKL